MHVDYAAAVAGVEALRDEFGAETIYRDMYERETGDRSQTSCFNTQENLDGSITGSCIVGRFVINALNISPLAIHYGSSVEGTRLMRVGAHTLVGWVRDHGHTVTDKAKDFLSALQGEQDNGTSWGNAIEAAKEWVVSGERNGFLRYNEDESYKREEF